MSAGGLVAVGCQEEEAVRAYNSPKAPADAAANAQPASVVPVIAAQEAPKEPKSPADAGAAPTWKVPGGWSQVPGRTGMRFATFIISQDPKVELTVIPLGPPQPLVDNINRWEGQLGAQPSSPEKVKEMVRTVELGDGGDKAQVVDLAGPGVGAPKQRMLGAIVDRGERIWFFKMMGPDEIVGKQKEAFDAFVKSIRFGPGAAEPEKEEKDGQKQDQQAAAARPAGPAAPMIAANAAGGEAITKYAAPEGWQEDKTPRPLRLMTFFANEGEKKAEVSVIRLGKDNIGGLLDNINRWRSQVGAPPVQSVDEKELPKVTVGGKEAYLIDVAGPDEKAPQRRQILAMAPRGDDVYFFKIIGDNDRVAAEKEKFTKFLSSIEFGGGDSK